MTGTRPAWPKFLTRMNAKIATPPWAGTEEGSRRPSIDAARRRLGGRVTAPSVMAPGSFVHATLRDGSSLPGVVLWATGGHVDLWFDEGLARRTRADAVIACQGPVPARLACVSAEMRLFAGLGEGDRVRWERAAGIAEGAIVEKCRYGAIVVTRDGKLVAVGFRKLWPVAGLAVA